MVDALMWENLNRLLESKLKGVKFVHPEKIIPLPKHKDWWSATVGNKTIITYKPSTHAPVRFNLPSRITDILADLSEWEKIKTCAINNGGCESILNLISPDGPKPHVVCVLKKKNHFGNKDYFYITGQRVEILESLNPNVAHGKMGQGGGGYN